MVIKIMNATWIFIFTLCLYNYIFDYIDSIKNKKTHNTKSVSKNTTNYEPIDIALTIGVLVFFIGVIICLIWFVKIPIHSFILFIIFLLFLIANINSAIKTAEPLKDVIFGNNEAKELSNKERLAFDSFVNLVALIYVYIPREKILSFFLSLNVDIIIKEIILTFVFLVYFFITSFFIVFLLALPFKHLRKISNIVFEYLDKAYKNILKYIGKKGDDWIPRALLTKLVLDFSNSNKGMFKIASYFLLLIAFILDFIIVAIRLFYIFVVYVFIGSVIELLRWIGLFLLKCIEALTSIPGSKVMKNSFRLALITSVVLVAVSIRYSFLIVFDDSYVGITEFVSSAIVIPLIFEWIHSRKLSKMT